MFFNSVILRLYLQHEIFWCFIRISSKEVTHLAVQRLLRVPSIRGSFGSVWLLAEHGWGSLRVFSVRAEWASVCSPPPSLWGQSLGEELERGRHRDVLPDSRMPQFLLHQRPVPVLSGPPLTDGRPSSCSTQHVGGGGEAKMVGVNPWRPEVQADEGPPL